MDRRCRSRCVGAVAAAALGTASRRGGVGLERHGGGPGIVGGAAPLRHPAPDTNRTNPRNKVCRCPMLTSTAQSCDAILITCYWAAGNNAGRLGDPLSGLFSLSRDECLGQ